MAIIFAAKRFTSAIPRPSCCAREPRGGQHGHKHKAHLYPVETPSSVKLFRENRDLCVREEEAPSRSGGCRGVASYSIDDVGGARYTGFFRGNLPSGDDVRVQQRCGNGPRPRAAGARRPCESTDPAGLRISCQGVAVDRVDPEHLFVALDRLDVEIDDDRLVVAAHQHAFKGLFGGRVDLLVRHIGRDKDEVAGPASATYSRCSPQRIRARPFST